MNFARVGVEDVYTVYLHLDFTVFGFEDVNVPLAKDHKEVAFTGVFKIVGHVEIGIHARLEHRDAAELAKLRSMCLVVEGTGDQ